MINSLARFMSSQALQDLAIDLQGDAFKWRWETFFIGPKQSADVLSKHLIIPLLSTADLAFTMQYAISGISDYDLEKVGVNGLIQSRATLFQFGAGQILAS